MKLTDRNVAALILPEGKDEHFEPVDEIPMLFVRLRGMAKTWVFQGRIGKLQFRIKIGDCSAMPAAAAREIARRYYAMVMLGQDPRAERKKTVEGETVGSMIRVYLARQAEALRPRSLVEVRRHLLTNAVSLHHLLLAGVDRRAIAALLARLGVSSGPIEANATRASLSAFLAWCCREGLIDVNPVVNTNRFPARSRERTLTDAEIKAVWKATADGGEYSVMVRLLMLLGARRAEIGDLLWSELDLDAALITLPPTRTKNGRAHVIPLPEAALELLRAQPCNSDRVFATRSWARSKRLLDERSGVSGFVLHDFRRVLSTRLHEKLGVAPHIVESILGHAIVGISGVYNKAVYLDERRKALSMWAEHVAAIVEDRPAKILADTGRPQ
jgi:integrase